MYNQLIKDIRACRLCEEHFGYEPHPITFGNERSKIMQISQAPSSNVHQTMTPFADASGRKLRQEWYRISDDAFYNPGNFYITAIAHCYPGKSPNGGDRVPPRRCADMWLKREIELVQNSIYILIGSKAASYFYPHSDFSELIFHDNVLFNRPAYVLPHPSPINVKWFQENPRFLSERVKHIERVVHEALMLWQL